MQQEDVLNINEGVSESHFYMWRAIFAIAHADGNVDKEEEAFMDRYLKSVPFTLQQKAILEDDIIHAKDPGEMLSHVSAPEDQGMFFQFARMMCWSNGNYDMQEKEIMERLLGAHMEKLDMEGLSKALHKSREEAESRVKEDEQYEKAQAAKKVGIGPLIASLFSSRDDKKLPRRGVTDSRFYMWRTIFALAHADDVVTEEERKFMHNVLDTERFSGEQRQILEDDIYEAQEIAPMFMKIGDQKDRSQFFYFARMLCWSDGNFDEQEQEIMLKLKSIHVRNVDINQMIGSVDMRIDDEYRKMLEEDMLRGNIFSNFLKRFKAA